MLIRQIHAYLSVFVAPTILFFAFTGVLQLYGLHEAHGGYHPPALIEKLGRVHKDQSFTLGRAHHESPSAAVKTSATGPATARGEGDWVKPLATTDHKAKDSRSAPAENFRTQALKALFCAAAVMLMVSVLLGVWMAFTQNRRKAVLLVIFLLGAAAPVAILVL
jgi:hypothetical protein